MVKMCLCKVDAHHKMTIRCYQLTACDLKLKIITYAAKSL